ncbi:MAG: hypothetical protein JWP71_2890 [Mucilaginibacter sp.]|nr:hypothetical protein [Mucilaginibacter sp.]
MMLNNRDKNQDVRIKINGCFDGFAYSDLFNHYFLDSCLLILIS